MSGQQQHVSNADGRRAVVAVRRAIFAWYKKHGRHTLPWRQTTVVYRVAIAEVMLQQTNVPKVIDKYTDFLAHFPTVGALAAAPQSEVVRQWRGLGYNRRALNLHKMAQAVVRDHGGRFPTDPQQLIVLPGIGPYTSRSIPIFARNADMATHDVNIVRVLRRWHDLDQQAIADSIEEMAAAYVPRGRSRDWHSALMDFASLVCTKRAPLCATCPLRRRCASYPAPRDPLVRKKKEIGRSEDGIHVPRRIYRGRIVEFLRHAPATRNAIGAAIKKDWTASADGAWCDGVLQTLAQDGMIVQTGRYWHLQ